MRRVTLRLLWDLFMVWVALANLGLILFDLSYLHLRPRYLRLARPLTELYDPVKGIAPHPLTEQLRCQLESLRRQLELDPAAAVIGPLRDSVSSLTLQVLEEDPFERSGQRRSLPKLTVLIATELGQPSVTLEERRQRREAVERFWSRDPELLSERLHRFLEQAGPMLAANHTRELTTGGRMLDRFWLLDLPFLALFWAEFATRWLCAIRRRTYARWFFFPFFSWYDLLGLVPSAYFRPLRLLRIASIYLRLRRSKLSSIGDDIISRSVAYVSNIITEEVSDMVSIRILEEYQQEIREGTHRRIFEHTIGTRRAEINHVVARQLSDVLNNPSSLQHFRELLRLNLENAVESSEALRSVPLPDLVLRPVVRAAGEVLLEATIETVTATINSRQGQELTHALVASVLDQLLSGPGLEELDAIASEIGLDIFEHMKETVAVKKWALPDRPVADEEPEPVADPEGGAGGREEDGTG